MSVDHLSTTNIVCRLAVTINTGMWIGVRKYAASLLRVNSTTVAAMFSFRWPPAPLNSISL